MMWEELDKTRQGRTSQRTKDESNRGNSTKEKQLGLDTREKN